MRAKLYLDNNNNNFPSLPKYKYSFNQKIHDLSVSSPLESKSNFSKIGRHGLTPKNMHTLPQKIKSNGNFSLEKINSSMIQYSQPLSATKNNKSKRLSIGNTKDKDLDNIRLPVLQKRQSNPQQIISIKTPDAYYQARALKSLKNTKQSSYLLNLAKQHFIQTIQALKIGKGMKPKVPQKQIKLSKSNPKFKTIYLDMDQTLIHCDQNSNNYTVKLNFPIQGGGIIAAGIRIRPYCDQFLKQLCTFAQVIIFTASASSYADVVLDYIDPQKKYFSHRLYRQHCTLQKGFFVKDLRVVNRRLQDSLLVDNSAFSFMFQPQNGVPILPFYHLAKDKQLLSLMQFLKKAVQYGDMRDLIKQTFFWQKYLKDTTDPRKILISSFQKQ